MAAAPIQIEYQVRPAAGNEAQVAQDAVRLQKIFNNAGRGFSSPLGNISRDFTQFDKSLDASTSRVLAFGLSAGAIIGVQRAFSSLVRETIAVDKSIRDINVIFNLAAKNLSAFKAELFDISRSTGQTFSAVADAAKELSRQGLSVSETLQRTKDSLVLVRQSGLDAESSVKAITVALNSFNKEALTSADVVNKLASVDARYAVSSADLADALSRVGSTASDANVSFNELLGVVTAVQQITGRSGSVIGNSLKSIFTRTSRADVIDQLRELGVAVSTSQNGIEKLKALADALKTATPETANVIKELAGGVYQINAVAAALNDLSSNYSITARATRDAANASNEAYIRNEQLNKSYEALINRTGTNLRQIGSGIGNLTVGPALEKILGTLNTVLEAAVSKDGNNVGEIMAKGLIKGFGEFISGPGLAVVVYGIGKLLARFTSEAATGFKTILGLNDAARQRANIEMAVSSILKSQPDLIATATVSYRAQLDIIQRINNALLIQNAERNNLARATAAVVNTGVSRNLFKTKAVGHIPEVQEKMGAYAAGYKPGKVKEMNVPDLGRIIYNDAEKVKYFPGMKQPAIIPPQTSRAGKSYKKEFERSHGFDPYANEGLIPNFAGFIGPTKRLLQGLKQAGIPVNRTKEGSEFKFPFSLNIQKGNKESSPVFDLFHEAGHYQAIGSGLDKIMKRPQGQAGLALAERLANSTALDLMSKTGFDSNLVKDKFKSYAQKNYDTYRKNQSGKFIKNIPSSPFSRGDLEFLFPGLVPNFASRFGPTKTQPIRLMDILHSGQFSQKQRQIMSYTSDGLSATEIASQLRMNPQEVEFIQKQMKQTLAGQFTDIKKGRMSLAGGLVPSFAKKFQPSVQLGKLLGRGSYKDIYNIQSFQPDLFGGLNIDPREAVAGILHRRNIKDFEKQEQLFKYGAPVPQIYGYEDVLVPSRFRDRAGNVQSYNKKNAAIIERIDPFSENDAQYIGRSSNKHEGDVIRNVSGVLSQYLKEKGYVDSYRKASGWGGIQGDLTLRNLGVKKGFSRGQALDELARLAQLDPLQKIGAGDVRYIDAIVANSGLSIADVGYLNPRKANKGLVPNYAVSGRGISDKQILSRLNAGANKGGYFSDFYDKYERKFFGSDYDKIAKLTRKDVKLLRYEPKSPDAMGLKVSGLGEYRIHEGKQVKQTGVFSKGLVPNYANPKDKFLSFLSQVGPGYVKSFRGLQKQDTGLAKFLRNSTDLIGAEAQGEMGKLLKKQLLQLTPRKYGLGTTIYPDLSDSPENIKGKIGEKFGQFGIQSPFNKGLIPNFAGFRTSQGSRYELNELGQTSRLKLSAGKGQGTTYEPHPVVYVKPEEAQRLLEEMQGGGRLLLGEFDKNGQYLQVRPDSKTSLTERKIGVGVVNRKTGQWLTHTFAKTKPELGLSPVEMLYSGDEKRMHIGNPISEIFSKGLIPNFASDPLTDAIVRENAAGINTARIKIGQSTQLKSNLNPLGLGVYNSIDEPGGLNQGINRAFKEGRNPKTYGVPNFAAKSPLEFEFGVPASLRKETEVAFKELTKKINAGAYSFGTLSNVINDFAKNQKVAVGPLLERFKQQLDPQTSKQIIGAGGGLYPSISQDPKQFFANIGGAKNLLAPQFAQLLKEAVIAEQNKGKVGYSSPIGPRLPIGYPSPIGPLPPGYPSPIGPYLPYPLKARPAPDYSRNVVPPPVISSSLYSRAYDRVNNLTQNPRFQNFALSSSFILPTLAGGVAEGIGDRTANQRGASQAVQSSANIASYGILGAQFGGPYGAVGGLAIGGLLEGPRVIKAFTDKIPDLTREIEKLTEKTNQANDGFSGIIQTNERLAQYNRGELDLTKSQVVNLNKGRSQQVSQLSLLFPEFAKDIRRVSYGNNINDIQEVAGNINNKQIREKRLLEGDRLSRTIVPQSDFGRVTKRTLAPTFGFLTDLLVNSPSLIFGGQERRDKFLKDRFGDSLPGLNRGPLGVLTAGSYRASYGPLKSDDKETLLAQFQNTFLASSDSKKYKDKTLSDILVEQTQGGDKNRLESFRKLLDIQPKEGEVGDFSQILGKALSSLPKENAGFNYQSFVDTYAGAKPNERAFLTDRLKEFIDSIFDQASVQDPNNGKKIAQDSTNLIKSFFGLRQELEIFTGRLQILTSSELAKIERDLTLNLSNINTKASIQSGRIQAFSPFGSIEAQRAGELNVNKITTESRIQALRTRAGNEDIGLTQGIFSNLQSTAEKRATNDDLNYGQTLANYERELALNLKDILPEKFNKQLLQSPQIAIESFLYDAKPQDFEDLYKKIPEARKKLFKKLDETTGKTSRDAIEAVISTYDKAITGRTLSKESTEREVQSLLENSANNIEIINNKANETKQNFINNLLQQDADIVENIDDYTKSLNRIYEKYNLQNPNFRELRGAQLETSINRLDKARGQYSAGNFGARELQPLTSDTARKQLRNDGSVSQQSLGDIFKSSFGYNKQDFGQDLISDMEGIREALTSIRPAAKDAFASIVDGSKSGSDALRQFGISIATNVLNNVAKLAFDNLFGNLFNNNTFGAIGSLFSAKSKGGVVGYASGGMVTGGSGVRDDVPAMLANGAYVIKKSSVNKYGSGFLKSIESGKGFANGGINQVLKNEFAITGSKENIKGTFAVDPRLSVIGQTDENNPSNALKFAREQDYYGYLGTIENYKKAVKQFEAAQTQRLIGAYVSGAINIGAYGLSTRTGEGSNYQNYGQFSNPHNASYLTGRNLGGIIRRYAGGGSVDAIPALLTGGEFVMSPQAVNRMGVGFMNRLNNGQISPSRYATGGFVGRDINAASPVRQDNSEWGQINSSLLELIKLNQEIRDLSNGTRSKVGDKNAPEANVESSTAIAPSVSITINMMGDKTNTQTQSNNTDNGGNGQNIKQFAELMKNVSLDTIVTQMRPGGLLANSVRK